MVRRAYHVLTWAHHAIGFCEGLKQYASAAKTAYMYRVLSHIIKILQSRLPICQVREGALPDTSSKELWWLNIHAPLCVLDCPRYTLCSTVHSWIFNLPYLLSCPIQAGEEDSGAKRDLFFSWIIWKFPKRSVQIHLLILLTFTFIYIRHFHSLTCLSVQQAGRSLYDVIRNEQSQSFPL